MDPGMFRDLHKAIIVLCFLCFLGGIVAVWLWGLIAPHVRFVIQ
jgi:hypothetical protein